MRSLSDYKSLLMGMAVNKKGNTIAPHKAILLLAVIDLIERRIITTPFVPISDELIRAFESIWKANVSEKSRFSCRIATPFFHMQSSPFWELTRTATYEGHIEYSSITTLKRDFLGAKIDDELFQYFSNDEARNEIRQLIKDYYLTNTTNSNPLNIGLLTLLGIILSVA